METHSAIIWLTGLSGVGKSTIAKLVAQRLRQINYRVEVLDGDEVRQNLSAGLGFSKADRDINICRIGFVCHLLSRNGVIAIGAVISPYRSVREDLKQKIPHFLEIFVNCPLEVCIQRDVKGLYAQALQGKIPAFTGISDPYEEPLNPDLTIYSHKEAAETSAQRVMNLLYERGYILP